MHTQGGDTVTTRSGVAFTPQVCIVFLIIQWTEVNYSAYTLVATPQDIDKGYILRTLLNKSEII